MKIVLPRLFVQRIESGMWLIGLREIVRLQPALYHKDVEIYSLYGKTPAEFGRILKDNGITASSGHYLLPAVKSEWHERI
jgi:hypothetical protein